MKELKPFTTLGPAKKALDNGGRFYNFFDAAEDEVVSRGELAKAAGVFTAGIRAFLFLEMTKQDLHDIGQSMLNCVCPIKRQNRALGTHSVRWSAQRAQKQHHETANSSSVS